MTSTHPRDSDAPESPDQLDHQAFEGGDRGGKSGSNAAQNRAVGIDDSIVEGSRQGRERYKTEIDHGEAEPRNSV
ncbi:hypothetical protein [Xylophilus ampelinus]|uniref:Uncharacterized protein n=1 Tax=Xylophilus ampelinus TaxID=54067 RepID=A0A318SGD7_9BURK|nr:hypothetical protein [Xylophilus ampelinus]MCS4510541.1 hypothetical protein [Xylophilus ampelinus]PYE77832.1 hypothetical protein DFQ15_11284 [Xylophilus ampelinus]